jgi:hypothetical protein
MMHVKRYILSFIGLFLISACSLQPEYWMRDKDSRFSPWHGFIYVAEEPGVEVRTYHGEYLTLTSCMETMQAKTKYNHYGYFCGFGCPQAENPYKALKCEKLMGSPLEVLD